MAEKCEFSENNTVVHCTMPAKIIGSKTPSPQFNVATSRIRGMHLFCAESFFGANFETGGWGARVLRGNAKRVRILRRNAVDPINLASIVD